MLKNIFFILGSIALIGIRNAEALNCYQCFACDQSIKIECNDSAVTSLNEAVSDIFHPISPTEGSRFDCITLAYLDGEAHAKFQGCIYDSDFTCSLQPRNLSTAYVCGTCRSDYCNSSAKISGMKAVFSLLTTIFATVVAKLL